MKGLFVVGTLQPASYQGVIFAHSFLDESEFRPKTVVLFEGVEEPFFRAERY